MTFMCNSCFTLMERDDMHGGTWILTSCFHIFCNACARQIRNNECKNCSQKCKLVKIGKDMPSALKVYFEPPLTKIEKIQQQMRFLQQQQEIALKLKKRVEEAQQKKAYRIRKILEMEQIAKAEEQRLEKDIKERMESYKRLKEKCQKVCAEKQRLLKCFEERGYQPGKDMSADSGMFSFEKSSRYGH